MLPKLGPAPLLTLDLDNTLIDRASAFRRWAVSFAAANAASADAADWLIMTDCDGLEPRERPVVVTNGTVHQQELKLSHTS